MSLTESMTRLCGEIVTLRGARLGFVRDLGQNVAAMKAGFRQVHTEMARRTRAERQDFVEALGQEVASLRAGFRRAHKDMARKTKAERRAATNHLKRSVSAMRVEFALDLAGAHRAFFGPSPTELKAKAEAERRARAEAERHAKAEAERHTRAEADRHAKEEAERQRLAALAQAKDEAIKHQTAREAKEAARPGKKKG